MKRRVVVRPAWFDPRWTYTVHGELPPKKVQVRQVKLPNSVFLDERNEMVLDIECVRELAPREWPVRKRFSVVMIGLGQQIGSHYYITQWASDWERELLDAVRPRLALARKIYIEARGDFDTEVLAGRWISGRSVRWSDPPLWPAVDVRQKTMNVRKTLREQDIGPQVDRDGDIRGKDVLKLWPDKGTREPVWKHNYLDVLETSLKIFQIEWPEVERDVSGIEKPKR
jgi:hypothetical protein